MRSTDSAGAIAPRSPAEIVRAGLCIGCGSCVAQAEPRSAHMTLDAYGFLKPAGSRRWYRARTRAFSRTCPFSPSARDEDRIAAERFPFARHVDGRVGRFDSAWVGHVEEDQFRLQGSSGGLVTWTAAELMRRGLVDAVAHVSAIPNPREDEAFFRYRVSRTEDELRAGAKSRYYPIELSGVIEAIRRVPGRYAVVGVPCFIKAIHLLREQDPVIRERVAFTLGLFCGHMKSARMVESFAWQLGRRVEEVEAVDYRAKNPDRPANWYTARLQLKGGGEARQDWFHFVDGDWGAGFFQNPACNFCDDVVAETADISFGDAWVEPYSSDGRGTNVAVVRAPLLDDVLREARAAGRLALSEVDADFIHRTQAAGFRHRREGLALRLARRSPFKLMPRKRVAPAAPAVTPRRKAVYLMRGHITAWSNRLFWLARRLRRPGLYTAPARRALALYQGLAWSQGKLGAAVDRLETWLARRARVRPAE